MVKKLSAQALRDDFVAWQCHIRQIAMRQDGGRPSPGMRPRLLDASGRELTQALTVLLLPRDPAESTAFFRFQVMRSADPRDIYERALAYLQADYFHKPDGFRDRMLAVLPEGSQLAASLVSAGTCILEFEQFAQAYRFTCAVSALKPGDAGREADWASAGADRRPGGQNAASF
jgi:hypothetical protein